LATRQNMSTRINILFFADSHLGIDHPLKPKVDKPRRGHDFFRNYAHILQVAVNENVDMVLHGGDVFNTPRIHAAIVDMAYDRLLAVADNGIPIVIVPGNHERGKLPPSLFLQHENIHVFQQPETFPFDIRGVPITISGFPYYYGDVRNAFPELKDDLRPYRAKNGINLWLFHHAVEGCKVANFTFRGREDTIRLTDMDGDYHAYLSGHIHRQQVLWTGHEVNGGKVPMLYPGSIERTSAMEMAEEKGYYMLHFELNDEGWKLAEMDFRVLQTRPMKTLELGEREYDADQIKAELLHFALNLDPQTIVRIRGQHEPSLALLSAALLKAIFPPTCHVSVSGFARRPRKSRKT
jgi:exonuclease SbcD